MTILEWPIQERPREKLLQHGTQSLSDAELLAVLWGSGTQGKSAVDLARDLLKQYNGLRSLFAATYADFSQIRGLGFSKYCQCQAALELSYRHLKESLERQGTMRQVNDVKRFLIAALRGHSQEVFACLFLDNRNRLIRFEKLFYGSINTTSVHPRIVIERCLLNKAAAVILAHNHPSGVPEPSQADCEITKILAKALQMIDVRLLDHMVIGDTEVCSLAERGLLAPHATI